MRTDVDDEDVKVDSTVCYIIVSSLPAMQPHRGRSQMHDRQSYVTSLLVVPQCPWCSSTFSSMNTAKMHAYQHVHKMCCAADRCVSETNFVDDMSVI